MWQDKGQLEQLTDLACDRAKKRGAQGAAASATLQRKYRVVIRDGKQEELTASVSRSLSLRIFVDGRYGSVSTSRLEPKQLLSFIDDAVSMTRVLMVDKNRALPDPRYFADRRQGELGLYDAQVEKLTMDTRKQRAMAAHDAVRTTAKDKLISAGAGFSDSRGLRVLRTTNGFCDARRVSSFGQWATASLKDPSGRRPSDWAEDSSRSWGKLGDPQAVGRSAAERTLAAIGAGRLETIRLPLIIENRAVGRVLHGFLSPLYGWMVDQKRSVFEHSLGKAIASPLLTVKDDPFVAGGWGSRRFDNEGLTTKERVLLQQGVLGFFYLDSYYARKLHRQPTVSRPTNLVFSAGTRDLEGLIKNAGKAIVVTGFLGGNANPTTGDFSHGIEGFLVEGGKRSRPIASMNIAGNHQTFWKCLVEVGNDPYRFSSQLTPSLLFSSMTVSGK